MGFFSSAPSITAAEAAESLRAGSAVALDVRERSEFESARIAGATLMPLGELNADTLDTSTHYIAVCASGARSGMAARKLRKAGFDVVNLKGGMAAWQAADLPTQRGRGRDR